MVSSREHLVQDSIDYELKLQLLHASYEERLKDLSSQLIVFFEGIETENTLKASANHDFFLNSL